jgi:hypothetical protein
MSDVSVVRKSMRSTAKVADVMSLTDDAVTPVRVAVRFALILALLAFVVSGVALGVAVSR